MRKRFNIQNQLKRGATRNDRRKNPENATQHTNTNAEWTQWQENNTKRKKTVNEETHTKKKNEREKNNETITNWERWDRYPTATHRHASVARATGEKHSGDRQTLGIIALVNNCRGEWGGVSGSEGRGDCSANWNTNRSSFPSLPPLPPSHPSLCSQPMQHKTHSNMGRYAIQTPYE